MDKVKQIMLQVPAYHSLKARNKGQRLTAEERKEVINQINQGVPIKAIQELFQISNSTIKRIIKNSQSNSEERDPPSRIKSRAIKNKELCKAVASFAVKNKRAFTWRDVKDHLITNNGILVDTCIWRWILKEELGYSYKRWSPRPLKLNYRVLNLKKALFAVVLLKAIWKSTLLVNIDESVISSTTKANYSWSIKGEPSNVSTIIYTGSVSIISSIFSNKVSISE